MKQTKQVELAELRKKLQLFFYNTNYPEAYSKDEIEKYETKVNHLMELFSKELAQAQQEAVERIDEKALEKGLRNFRKLRLIDYQPLMDEAPPSETVLSVLKSGLGGMFDDQAVKYIYEKAIRYYLKALKKEQE